MLKITHSQHCFTFNAVQRAKSSPFGAWGLYMGNSVKCTNLWAKKNPRTEIYDCTEILLLEDEKIFLHDKVYYKFDKQHYEHKEHEILYLFAAALYGISCAGIGAESTADSRRNG